MGVEQGLVAALAAAGDGLARGAVQGVVGQDMRLPPLVLGARDVAERVVMRGPEAGVGVGTLPGAVQGVELGAPVGAVGVLDVDAVPVLVQDVGDDVGHPGRGMGGDRGQAVQGVVALLDRVAQGVHRAEEVAVGVIGQGGNTLIVWDIMLRQDERQSLTEFI